MHGGSAPQVRAMAEQRKAEAAAEKLLTNLVPERSEERRITDPMRALEELAGQQQETLHRLGERINSINAMSTGKDLQMLRAEWIAYLRLQRDYQTNLQGMTSLGISERYVELEKTKVEIVVSALFLAMDAVGLDEVQRGAMSAAFLAGIGRPMPVPAIVAGELA
jgi:hypothetical protein